jgi:hypothetical protein
MSHVRDQQQPGAGDKLLAKLHVITVLMATNIDIRTDRHCASVCPLAAHLVFATRYRHAVFADRHLVWPVLRQNIEQQNRPG